MRSSTEARSGWLTRVTGRSLQAALIFGPLAFACTRPWPFFALCASLHFVSIFWLLALWKEDRAPRINRVALSSAALLLVYVWVRGFVLAPPTTEAFTVNHFARIAQRWPESVIWRTPERITALVSGLILTFLVATDLAAIPRWRRRFVRTMVGTALVVVVLGLLQNATHAPGIYWEKPFISMPSQFFGPFFHFTSAGAFINLSWPVALAMALYSWQHYKLAGSGQKFAWIWTAATFLLLLAHTAHISRFPQVIAGLSLIIMVAVLRPWRLITWSPRSLVLLGVTAALMAMVAFGVIHKTGQLHRMASRWSFLEIRPRTQIAIPPPPRSEWSHLMRDDLIVPYSDDNYFLRDRGAAYAFAWKCFLLRPLFGFGPAGWITAISQYATDPTIGTFYLYLQFSHEDYLQTLVEWGSIGVVLALLIVGSALMNGIRAVFSLVAGRNFRDQTQAVTFGALIALFTVLIQSLVDFPLQIPANALYACMLLAMCFSSFLKPITPLTFSSDRHGQ